MHRPYKGLIPVAPKGALKRSFLMHSMHCHRSNDKLLFCSFAYVVTSMINIKAKDPYS